MSRMPERGTGPGVIGSGPARAERNGVGADRQHTPDALVGLLTNPSEPFVARGDEPLDFEQEQSRRALEARDRQCDGKADFGQRRKEAGAADRTVYLDDENRAVEPGRLGRDTADR